MPVLSPPRATPRVSTAAEGASATSAMPMVASAPAKTVSRHCRSGGEHHGRIDGNAVDAIAERADESHLRGIEAELRAEGRDEETIGEARDAVGDGDERQACSCELGGLAASQDVGRGWGLFGDCHGATPLMGTPRIGA